MAIHRMDHVGIVVEDLAAAVAFFVELGMEVEGEATVSGQWADDLLALEGVRTDMVLVRTPDGQGRVELSTFRSPATTDTAPKAPVTTPGIPRLTFVVDDVEDVVTRLRARGGEPVGTIARYEDYCRYVYIRGPEGILLGLVEELH